MTNQTQNLVIKNNTANAFYQSFSRHRQVNIDFYLQVSEEKFDYRLTLQADSIKESLLHLIDTTKDYVWGIREGNLIFNREYNELFKLQNSLFCNKNKLIKCLRDTNQELIQILCLDDIEQKLVKTPWSQHPLKALDVIWGLQNHEILHTGWNIAIMDALEIKRFKSLRQLWG